jgi:hypothetical protein
MHSSDSPYHIALRRSRLSGPHGRLYRAELALYADRLSLSGWSWRGPYRRDIFLQTISDVVLPGDDRLDLYLNSGETLLFTLPAADYWRQAIIAHRDVAAS